ARAARDFPDRAGRERTARAVHDAHRPARRGRAESPGPHSVAHEAGVIHEDDTNLRAAVHAARNRAERPREEVASGGVHRLPREQAFSRPGGPRPPPPPPPPPPRRPPPPP